MESSDEKSARTEEAEFTPRKRLRSSGSYTDESNNSDETSPKKVKVQNDSSFELSEKVPNIHQGNGESDLKDPSEINADNEQIDAVKNATKDTLSDTPAKTTTKGSNVLSSKPEDFFRKSVKQQVQELAKDQGMQTKYSFSNPPGYEYNPSKQPESGDYEVCLNLQGEESSESFSGRGSMPYEAIRVAFKKAREFLTDESGACWSPGQKQSDSQTESANCTIGEEEEHENVEAVNRNGDSVDSTLGKDNAEEPEQMKDEINGHEVKDSDDDAGDYEGDEEQGDERIDGEQVISNWVHSLESFWDKALASKYPTISVNYCDMDQQEEEEEHLVECSIGKLVVEGTGNTKDIAREKAAQYMFSMIETILENEGTDTLKKNIIEGDDSEETSANFSTVNQPPFKDETAVETIDEEENSEDEYEEDSVVSQKLRTVEPQEEVIGSSSEDSNPAPSPKKHPEPAGLAPPTPMLSGAEYCLAVARVDMPEERPMLLDLPNMPRRVKAGMANKLVSLLKDGEYSDEEEQESERMLEIVQNLLSMSTSMSDRHKHKMMEMFSRSGLTQIRPSMPLGGLAGAAGFGQQYHQLYQQQPAYPGLQAGAGYPSQKARLLAGVQAPAQPQPPPPKPIVPLKNLCQFPLPGAIEGVGSVTVTLEDYKTLQVGTFLNDVIIDFYLKYLQYTQFSEQDKNGVHIFTTFWFSRLTSKPSPIEARKDPVQRRYDRVKRWTRKVNIFEKDFVVVPINENYHWYLCIICYPGMVGCKDMQTNSPCPTPARQKNRRRAKDKIKVLRSKMNAKPRKDESDERDEPLASEDEIEHESDSVDVEQWKERLVEWERQEIIRKKEEEKRMLELERQRREWEERRRHYEEQQRKLYEEQQRQYEEQQRLYEEEQQRLAMEQEDMGEEEENWDDDVKYDEDGNPVEEKYNEFGELITDGYDEYGEPLDYEDEPMEEGEEQCENGGFADAAKYKTSTDRNEATESEIPVKAKAMAADWDDWGDDDDAEEAMEQDASMDEDDGNSPFYYSLLAHTVANDPTEIISAATQLHTTNTTVAESAELSEEDIETNDEDKSKPKPPQFISSLVCHSVSWAKSKEETFNAAIIHNLEQNQIIFSSSNVGNDIPQVDGIVDDEGSDEEMGEKENTDSKVDAEDTIPKVEDEDAEDTIPKVEDEDTISKVQDEDSSSIVQDEDTCSKVQDEDTSSKVQDEDTSSKVENEDTSSNVDNDSTEREGDNQECRQVESGDICDDESNMSTEEVIDTKCENEEPVESDEEVTMKLPGLVGYADTGDDSDTEAETTNTELVDAQKSPATEPDEAVVDEQFLRKGETSKFELPINSNIEDDYQSSSTEDYDGDEDENGGKQIETNFDDGQSDSEIEEVEVAEKESSEHDQEKSEDPSERSESESEASESDDEDEDISKDVPVKQPCILVFDSLGGKKDRQSRLCATLRDFLTKEFEEKYPGQTREFSTRTMPGGAPKVPQQPNLTDCGLFLCHNVETFFKAPIADYTMPITSLSSWFPDSESRYKRRDVAGIIKKLATQQNQDKLEQLQLPDLVFVEPERARPVQRFERANSPGSDGDNVDEYNSEDDYDEEDDEQGKSDRYSSSPRAKNRVSTHERNEAFSTEDDEYYSDKEERNGIKYSEERRPKRYRSDDSGSDDERKSRHQKRRSERTSSSESERSDEEFNPSAVYGRQDAGLNSPMKKLPPGISISRAVEPDSHRAQPQTRDTFTQQQPEIQRRLPPGISISRTSNLPAGLSLTISSTSTSTTTPVRDNIVRCDQEVGDPNQVTIEDVSDCSDEFEIFDLDDPAHKRTFLPIIAPITTKADKMEDETSKRLFSLPPGVSISRGGRKDEEVGGTEDDEEFDENMDGSDENMDGSDDEKMDGSDDEKLVGSYDDHHDAIEAHEEELLPSMVAHLASTIGASVDTSMVAHQVIKTEEELEQAPQDVPQVDGMNDLDSEEDENPSGSDAVNQDQEASEGYIEEQNPVADQGEANILPPEVVESNNDDIILNQSDAVELSADDVDNIDNHGLEEGEEIYPTGASLHENQEEEDVKAGEEFKNEDFDDDGSNLQSAEEIDDFNNTLSQHENLPTEEAMNSYDDTEFEQGVEDVNILGESSDVMDNTNDETENEETIEGEDQVLDTSGEFMDDGAEVIDDTEVIDEGEEVYDDTDVLDNNQEGYSYEEGDEDEMYEEEDYSYTYNPPPVKRAKMSPEAEVVLDSESEDDSPSPQAAPIPVQQPNTLQNQLFAQQQAMRLAQQQAQLRSAYQPVQQQQRALPPGLSLTQYQQFAQARQGQAHQYSHQQQQQQQQQLPTQNSRKRKLESQALCFKDGNVFLKPFSQLPPSLLGESRSQQEYKPSTAKPNPLYTDPYKPRPGPHPYQPALAVHHLSAQRYPALARKVGEDVGESALERIRQLPAGISVQRGEERRDSVEDEEYHSDEPEEVGDGQEADEDLDILDDNQSNKDIYSDEEESFDEAVNVNESEEHFEDENSRESDDPDHDVEVARSIEVNEKASPDVNLEFEDTGVDIQEACEVNDKEMETHLENNPTVEICTSAGTEASDKLGDLIEGEEVAECDESQNNVEEASAVSEAEMAE